MGVSYIMFTEFKYKDKWYCINSNALVVDSKEKYKLIPTLQNSSRRGFEPVYRKLDEHSYGISIDKISENLRSSLKSWGISEEDLIFAVDIESLEKCCKEKPVQYSAFALRSDIRDYETGLEDNIYDYVTAAEYRVMDRELKKAYQYYEWNERFGWFEYFKRIISTMYQHRNEFELANDEFQIEGEMRLLLFSS